MADIPERGDLHPAWGERFNAGDVDGMLALAEDGFGVRGTAGVVVTGDDYRAALEQFVQLGLPIDLNLRRQNVVGDIALLVYDWTMERHRPAGQGGRHAGHDRRRRPLMPADRIT